MFYSQTNDGDRYRGRRLIDRHSRVNGRTTIIGTTDNPFFDALYVSREGHNNGLYNEVFEAVKLRAARMPGGVSNTQNFVQAVYEEISSRVTYSIPKSEQIWMRIAKNEGFTPPYDGAPAEVFDFVREGYGVCRHMGLACAAVLERAIDEGLIDGKVNYHRSIHTSDSNQRDGHAWARFTDPSGGRWVLDVAHQYCGRLESASVRGWNYLTDDEAQGVAPPKVANYAMLDKQPDGKLRIAEVFETNEKAFSSDLVKQASGKYSFLIATTRSGNSYLIGYDPTAQKSFVVNQKNLPRGRATTQLLDEAVSVRVGEAIEFQSQGRGSWTSPVIKIVAVERAARQDISGFKWRTDGAPIRRLLDNFDAAMQRSVCRLGPARDERARRDPSRSQRVADVLDTDSTPVDLGALLRSGYRKAWVHTTSGNCYEVQLERGKYKVTDTNKAKSAGQLVTRDSRALPTFRIGEAFRSDQGTSTEVAKVVLEHQTLYTDNETRQLTNSQTESATVAVEASMSHLSAAPQILDTGSLAS